MRGTRDKQTNSTLGQYMCQRPLKSRRNDGSLPSVCQICTALRSQPLVSLPDGTLTTDLLRGKNLPPKGLWRLFQRDSELLVLLPEGSCWISQYTDYRQPSVSFLPPCHFACHIYTTGLLGPWRREVQDTLSHKRTSLHLFVSEAVSPCGTLNP